MTFAQDSLNMRLLSVWDDPTLPASGLYDNTYNGCWGYYRDGREYGIIGSTMGTHIVDVTDPYLPVELHFIAGAVQGPNIIHREYKTYSDRLYAVTDEGPGTLQIIDLRGLPDSANVIYDSSDLFYRAHTLWIDTVNARLYTHAGSTDFAIYSLADPDLPTLLLSPQVSVPWWTDVGVVHDAYTVGNVTYTNDVDAMHIIDFTNVNAPVLLGSLTNYPQPGYNHSGWLSDNGWLYAMCDETHGTRVKLFDVSDPNDIQFIDTIGPATRSNNIPHNPCFQGDLLHIAYYYDGYWLYDVSDPANAQLLGYYDGSLIPDGFSYKGVWGVYPYLPSGIVLGGDMQRGLMVFDISQALAVKERSTKPESALHVWPNPAADEVRIALDRSRPERLRVQLIDMQGRTVLQTLVNGDEPLDIRTLRQGTYVVKATTNERTMTARLIKTTAR
jgi:choice-of-anchor B domain-containing protein